MHAVDKEVIINLFSGQKGSEASVGTQATFFFFSLPDPVSFRNQPFDPTNSLKSNGCTHLKLQKMDSTYNSHQRTHANYFVLHSLRPFLICLFFACFWNKFYGSFVLITLFLRVILQVTFSLLCVVEMRSSVSSSIHNSTTKSVLWPSCPCCYSIVSIDPFLTWTCRSLLFFKFISFSLFLNCLLIFFLLLYIWFHSCKRLVCINLSLHNSQTSYGLSVLLP